MISDVKLNLSTSSLNEHIMKAMENIKTNKEKTENKCKNFYTHHNHEVFLFGALDNKSFEVEYKTKTKSTEVLSIKRKPGGSQNPFKHIADGKTTNINFKKTKLDQKTQDKLSKSSVMRVIFLKKICGDLRGYQNKVIHVSNVLNHLINHNLEKSTYHDVCKAKYCFINYLPPSMLLLNNNVKFTDYVIPSLSEKEKNNFSDAIDIETQVLNNEIKQANRHLFDFKEEGTTLTVPNFMCDDLVQTLNHQIMVLKDDSIEQSQRTIETFYKFSGGSKCKEYKDLLLENNTSSLLEITAGYVDLNKTLYHSKILAPVLLKLYKHQEKKGKTKISNILLINDVAVSSVLEWFKYLHHIIQFHPQYNNNSEPNSTVEVEENNALEMMDSIDTSHFKNM